MQTFCVILNERLFGFSQAALTAQPCLALFSGCVFQHTTFVSRTRLRYKVRTDGTDKAALSFIFAQFHPLKGLWFYPSRREINTAKCSRSYLPLDQCGLHAAELVYDPGKPKGCYIMKAREKAPDYSQHQKYKRIRTDLLMLISI